MKERRFRKQQSELTYLRQKVQALTPAPPAILCDIYRRDALSFLNYEQLFKCRQVSAELDWKICAWQSRGGLPNRVAVSLSLQTVSVAKL